LITIISPKEFKAIPWKNGLGVTTELAISKPGDIHHFDWRLSIASVVENGVFSNFSGYQRNLILISGDGLTLQHDNQHVDTLNHILDIAHFDGGCETLGQLHNGAIKDFNIITNKKTTHTTVNCYRQPQHVEMILTKNNLCFAYSLSDQIQLHIDKKFETVAKGNLVQISGLNDTYNKDELTVELTGKDMIVVQIEYINHA